MNKVHLLKKPFNLFIFSITAIGSLLACSNEKDLKTQQYYVEGYQLYQNNCANCHLENGDGLANLYPSVTNPKLYSDESALARLIKYGTKSNGEKHRPMPANPNLKNLEIAEIMTFMRVKWGKDSVYTATETVSKALETQL